MWRSIMTLAVFGVALSAPGARAEVPFPATNEAIGPHCLAAANGGMALAQRYQLDKNAQQLGTQGKALRAKMQSTSSLSRKYLESLQSKDSPLPNQVRAFLSGVGLMNGEGQFQWSPAGAQEVASHLTRCDTWTADRPPELSALPQEGAAVVDHCTMVLMTADGLGGFRGNRSGEVGALIGQVARNSSQMLDEMQRRGMFNPAELRKRASPGGELHAPGMDMVVGLKLANLGAESSIDVRSVRLLDERMRQCHRKLGLQLPMS